MIPRSSTFLANLKIVGGLNPSPRRWPMLARMAKAYLDVAIFNRRPFRFFDIALNYSCNLSCVHCSALDLVCRERRQLTHDDYRRFVREAMRYGCTVFQFTGGEPLLRKDIFELVRIFRPAWNMISIQTNGTLLSQDMVDQLHVSGIRSICMSLDSADPAEHDAFRGQKGSFVRSLEGLDRAISKGFSCAVVFCVSHQSLRAESTMRLIRLIGDRGVNGFMTLAVPIGRWAGREDVMITREDREYINELILKYPFLRTDFESNWRDSGCPAMKEKAYLSPYGDVLPCPFIQVSYGNIRTEPVSVILDRGRHAPEFGHYPPLCRAAEDVSWVRTVRCYEKGRADLPVNRADAFRPPDDGPAPCASCGCMAEGSSTCVAFNR